MNRVVRGLTIVLFVGATAQVFGTGLGTSFSYQGRLVRNGTPVTNSCSFTFALFDDATAGTEQGDSPQSVLGVSVNNGLFSVELDYGADAIKGEARWLEISVFCSGDMSPSTLSPRVELTPIPHAMALPGLYTVQNSESPNLIGGFHQNEISVGLVGATISGGGRAGDLNRITDDFCTVSGGLGNYAGFNESSGLPGPYATVGGGKQNSASRLYATVSGGFLNSATGHNGTVGGGSNNTASYDATVAGGSNNFATGSHSAIPGGFFNIAGGEYSFAIGRNAKVRDDAESGDANGDEGTFIWNDATGGTFQSSGPNQFLISAAGGVGINTNVPDAPLNVDGGTDANLNDGSGYVVVGSVAGANVVLDNNEIVARLDGDASELYLNNGSGFIGMMRSTASYPLHVGNSTSNGNGAHLTPGGVWTNGSDRNSKKNFTDVDKIDLLRKVAQLPITRWQYKDEAEDVRHIGPVAQDFYAAFGTGDNDRYIGTIDADGVALAAIQGLNQIVQDKDCEINHLKDEVAELKVMMIALITKAEGGAK